MGIEDKRVISSERELLGNDDFSNCLFEGIALEEGTEIREISFYDCEFLNCNWGRCVLSSCQFNDCRFEGCDLSLVQLRDSALARVEFCSCRLMGIDWTLLKWARVLPMRRPKFPVRFAGCQLDYSVFVGMNLYRSSFADCEIKEACFDDAFLGQAAFDSCNLMAASFRGANLEKSDFSSARNYTINPCDSRVKGARFSIPEALSLLYALDIDLEGV